jgi:signal peptidase I
LNTGTYFGLLIICAPFFIAVYAGLWKLFQKAGEPGWKAIIPFYSSFIMLKLSGRPGWWLIWVFIPAATWIISAGIVVDFIKNYGKFSIRHRAAAILLPFIYLPKWGFESKTIYLGPSASPAFKAEYPQSRRPGSAIQWGQALFFAVFTAAFTRAFLVEFYTIPTPSMERTLLVGDYIMVSKLNYGERIAMTPVSFPFSVNTMPYLGTKSYWDGLKLPYFRLPGFSSVKRGDVVVFNYPADTINDRPADTREDYIKRCEAIAGDTLKVVDGQVYVNGKASPNPPGKEMEYSYQTTDEGISPELLSKLEVTTYQGHDYPAMTEASAKLLKGNSNIKNMLPVLAPKNIPEGVFPSGGISPLHVMLTKRLPNYQWNVDNYGPVIIPKKGWTVKLDSMNFPIYERIIEAYENNKLEVKGGNIYINGKQTNSYTFKMNYYWMMGDNRHDTEDSRYWGFVPEDHVIGKAVLIWANWDPSQLKFRWDRIMRSIN